MEIWSGFLGVLWVSVSNSRMLIVLILVCGSFVGVVFEFLLGEWS